MSRVSHLAHPRYGRCAFCQALTRLWSENINNDFAAYNAAVEALWDQADGAAAARRAYGKKHRR